MTSNYEAVKKMKAKYASLKVCSNGCGRPLKTITLCQECSIKKRLSQNPKRNKKRIGLIKNGLCAEDCGRKLFSKWYCKQCCLNHSKMSKIYYRKDINKSRKYALKIAHKKNFGGLRDSVIKRYGNKCRRCDSSDNINVHHINEIKTDNRIENLVTLCKSCHSSIHTSSRHHKKHSSIFISDLI